MLRLARLIIDQKKKKINFPQFVKLQALLTVLSVDIPNTLTRFNLPLEKILKLKLKIEALFVLLSTLTKNKRKQHIIVK